MGGVQARQLLQARTRARRTAATKSATRRKASRAARSKPPSSTITRPKQIVSNSGRNKLRRNNRRAYNSERSALSMARAQRQAEKRQSKYNYGSYGGGIRSEGAIKQRRKKASMSQKYGNKKLGYGGKKTWHW